MYAFRNLDKEEKDEIILLFNKIDDNVDVDLYIIGFSKNYKNYNITRSSVVQSVFTKGYTADMCYKDLGALNANRVLTLPGERATTIVLAR